MSNSDNELNLPIPLGNSNQIQQIKDELHSSGSSTQSPMMTKNMQSIQVEESHNNLGEKTNVFKQCTSNQHIIQAKDKTHIPMIQFITNGENMSTKLN